jgi:hypothetical protein
MSATNNQFSLACAASNSNFDLALLAPGPLLTWNPSA